MSENNLRCSECNSLLIKSDEYIVCSSCGLVYLEERYNSELKFNDNISLHIKTLDNMSCININDINKIPIENKKLFIRLRNIDRVSIWNSENSYVYRVIGKYRTTFQTTYKCEYFIKNEMKILMKHNSDLKYIDAYIISYLNFQYLNNIYVGLKELYNKIRLTSRLSLVKTNMLYRRSNMAKFIPNRFLTEVYSCIIKLNNYYEEYNNNDLIINECNRIKSIADKSNYQTNTSIFALFSVIQAFRNIYNDEIKFSEISSALNKPKNWFHQYRFQIRRNGVEI